MSLAKKNLGRLGEELASKYLTSKGYSILHRNFRAKQYGEVDIIARHPDLKRLIFVEIKTRLSTNFGAPEDAITRNKISELNKMVNYYFFLYPNNSFSPQIDVISILLSENLNLKSFRHFENITL